MTSVLIIVSRDSVLWVKTILSSAPKLMKYFKTNIWVIREGRRINIVFEISTNKTKQFAERVKWVFSYNSTVWYLSAFLFEVCLTITFEYINRLFRKTWHTCSVFYPTDPYCFDLEPPPENRVRKTKIWGRHNLEKIATINVGN